MPTHYRSTYRRYPRKSKAASRIQSAFRSRKRKYAPKRTMVKAVAKNVVKRELNKQTETKYSASRTMRSPSLQGSTFGQVAYFLGNLGGSSPIQASSFTEMNTIKALAINQDIATGLPTFNNTFDGKNIFAKYFKSEVRLTMPSVRTNPTGGADQQQLPINFEYRCLFFKQGKRPAATQYSLASGLAAQPCFSIVRNAVGTAMGPRSTDASCLPEVDNPTVNGPWYSSDLVDGFFNKQSFKLLKEYRGKISVGATMNAVDNNAVLTSGGQRHPNEVTFKLHVPINKKVLMTQGNTSSQTVAVSTPLNYDTSIYVMILLNPLGEVATYESTWNTAIAPYIDINNTFAWTDM
jgi:hypothetical protein